MEPWTLGLPSIWNPTAAWQFDLALEEYDMRGKDGVTPQSAYSNARMITAGAKFAW